MKKVGILLNSTSCRKHLYNTISELEKSDRIELFFLLNRSISKPQGLLQKSWSTIKTQGMFRFIDLVVFKLLTTGEHKFVSIFSKETKEHEKIFNLEEFNKLPTTLRSGY